MKKLLVLIVAMMLVVAIAIPSMAGLTVSGMLRTVVKYDFQGGAAGTRNYIVDFINCTEILTTFTFKTSNALVIVPVYIKGNNPGVGGEQASSTFVLTTQDKNGYRFVWAEYNTDPFWFKYQADWDNYEKGLWGKTVDPMDLVCRESKFVPDTPTNLKENVAIASWYRNDTVQIGGEYEGFNIYMQTNAMYDYWWAENYVYALAFTATKNIFGFELGYLYASATGKLTSTASPSDTHTARTNNELWLKGNIGFGNLTLARSDFYSDGIYDGAGYLLSLSDVDLGFGMLKARLVASEFDYRAVMARNMNFDEGAHQYIGSMSSIGYAYNKRTTALVASQPYFFDGAKDKQNFYLNLSAASGDPMQTWGWFGEYIQCWENNALEYDQIYDYSAYATTTTGKLNFLMELAKVKLLGINMTFFNIYNTQFGVDSPEALSDTIGTLGEVSLNLFGVKNKIKYNLSYTMSMNDTDVAFIPVLVNVNTTISKQIKWSNNLHILSWNNGSSDGLLYDYSTLLNWNGIIKNMNVNAAFSLPMGEDEATDDRMDTYGAHFAIDASYKFNLLDMVDFDAYAQVNLGSLLRDESFTWMLYALQASAQITDKLSVIGMGAVSDTTDDATAIASWAKVIDRWGTYVSLTYQINPNTKFQFIWNQFQILTTDYQSAKQTKFTQGLQTATPWFDLAGVSNIYAEYQVQYDDCGWSLIYGKFPYGYGDGTGVDAFKGFFMNLMEGRQYAKDNNWSGEESKYGYESSWYTKNLMRFKFWIKF